MYEQLFCILRVIQFRAENDRLISNLAVLPLVPLYIYKVRDTQLAAYCGYGDDVRPSDFRTTPSVQSLFPFLPSPLSLSLSLSLPRHQQLGRPPRMTHCARISARHWNPRTGSRLCTLSSYWRTSPGLRARSGQVRAGQVRSGQVRSEVDPPPLQTDSDRPSENY